MHDINGNKKKQMIIIGLSAAVLGLILVVCMMAAIIMGMKKDDSSKQQEAAAVSTEEDSTEASESDTADKEDIAAVKKIALDEPERITDETEPLEDIKLVDDMGDMDMTFHVLNDIGLIVGIPSECVVFTREMKTENEWMIKNGVTLEEASDTFLQGDKYLMAWDGYGMDFMISIYLTGSLQPDFGDINEIKMQEQVVLRKARMLSNGETIIDCGVYESEHAKYIKSYFTDESLEKDFCVLEYMTVVGNNEILIRYSSKTDKLMPSQMDLMKNIVDSIIFTGKPAADSKESNSGSMASVYKDDKTGITFMIPDNWFRMNEDEGDTMDWYTYDGSIVRYWNIDTLEYNPSMKREYVDNSALPKSELAKMLNVENDDISMGTYGGEIYYKVDVQDTADENYECRQFIKVHNGYVHVFQCYEIKGSIYYDDFENIVSSVQYP